MSSEKPVVSIVTPAYNSKSYIKEMIYSIINQTFKDWELLITDDCSTDNTWEILNEIALKDERIKIYKLSKNSGSGVARNSSIDKASGRYLTFCDSDDLWEKDFLEKSIEFSERNNSSFTFASYYRKNEDLTKKFTDFIVPDKVSYQDVLRTCPISCLTAFIDIERLGKKKMPSLKKRQDAALWLSYLKETEYAYGIKKPLATYRMRENSLSRNKLKVIKYQWLLYRESEKLPIIRSIYLITQWAYNGFFKYFNI